MYYKYIKYVVHIYSINMSTKLDDGWFKTVSPVVLK
jgi:hypothetical protein